MGVNDYQRFPGLKCLLLRKVGKSNLENFEDRRRRLLRRLPHEFSVSRGVLTFPNESRIIARHFQCEKDIDAYLGLAAGLASAHLFHHQPRRRGCAEYRDILDGTRLVDWLPSHPHDPSRPEEVLKVDPDDIAPSDGREQFAAR